MTLHVVVLLSYALSLIILGISMKKIMVVDDELEILNIFEMVLKDNGYEPVLFDNGGDAFNYIQQETTPCFAGIIDAKMPNFDVVKFVAQCKMPTIICSAFDQILCKKTLVDSGVSFFYPKPMDLDRLIKVLDYNFSNPDLFFSERKYLRENRLSIDPNIVLKVNNYEKPIYLNNFSIGGCNISTRTDDFCDLDSIDFSVELQRIHFFGKAHKIWHEITKEGFSKIGYKFDEATVNKLAQNIAVLNSTLFRHSPNDPYQIPVGKVIN